jgi:hypothetical protein
MTPISGLILLAGVLAATFAPWRRLNWKPGPRRALLVESGAILVLLIAASLAGRLDLPWHLSWRWGRIALLAAAYWYACVGGAALVRLVLGLVPVAVRPPAGGIAVPEKELARGRLIGVLERAVVLTLVLLGQFGALGLVLAAKSVARFKSLDDRDFAEYFLIGTLASVLVALVVGVGVRLALA